MAKQPPPHIIVIGSINMDLIAKIDRLPKPGETISGGDLLTVPGGKGANQAVAAARLGAKTFMVGRVGGNAFGQTLIEGLRRSGVDTTHVRVTAGASSGTATILLQKGGENSIVLSPGANALVTKRDVDRAMPVIRKADAVLLQLEIPIDVVAYAAAKAKAAGVRVILDPAPVPKGKLPKVLHHVDVISPNQSEAATLLGGGAADEKNIEKICRRLLDRGAANVALKLGPSGSLHADATLVMTQVNGFKVKVVDTTAAGDTFTAGLAVALSEGRSWADALRFANAAGALACTKLGAQPSIPKRADVLRLLPAR
jgi:ribokinase